jgi:aminoglycoside phosphotransferase (APT) family kinase protein
MCTVGDPKLDLAWTVQSWPEDTMAPEAGETGYVDMIGMPSREQMLQHYAEVSGRQVDDIDYYLVLAKWKLAVVLEQGFQRAGDDEKLLAFGPIVLDLMQGAADMAATTDYAVS